jgi:hypothetical protein
MMYGKAKPAAKSAAKKPAGFKTCASCPNPTKCKAMGKCMMAGKKK